MTIDKTLLENVLAQIALTEESVTSLEQSVTTADAEHPLDTEFTSIYVNIDDIRTWAYQRLLETNQEEVMSNFLAELKLVFDKYSAKIEIGSNSTGYGEAYGEGETAVGIKLTATLDGVSVTKEINKSTIVSGDLV